MFEHWANLVNNIDGDGATSLEHYRKNIVINVLNLQGVGDLLQAAAGPGFRTSPALPDLDAGNMNTIGIQSITFQHEGWQRDTSVAEPTES